VCVSMTQRLIYGDLVANKLPTAATENTLSDSGIGTTDVASAVSLKHATVTLDTNADTILTLSTQQLGLDTQVANRVWAGPTTGAAAVPTFRALVATDIPALSYAPITHNILDSTYHGDVLTGSILRGDILYGNATPKIARLAKGAAGAVLTGDGTDTAWSTYYLSGTAAQTYTFPAVGGTVALLNAANVFTTTQTVSIPGTGQTPWTALSPNSMSHHAGDYNMGYKFTVNAAGQITKLRLRVGDTGVHNVRLYDSGGTVLATASITGVVDTWVSADITPVNVTVGNWYVVAARINAGTWNQETTSYPQTSGSITINECRYLSASDAIPTNSTTSYMDGEADIYFVPTLSLSFDGTFTVNASTVSFPVSGAAAMIPYANIFTAHQTINANSTTALLVEQTGVNSNTFVVDTTNKAIGINVAASSAIGTLYLKSGLTGVSNIDGVIFYNSNLSAYAQLGVGYSIPFVYGNPSLILGGQNENYANGGYIVTRRDVYGTANQRGNIEMECGYYPSSSMYGNFAVWVATNVRSGSPGVASLEVKYTGQCALTGITDIQQLVCTGFTTQAQATALVGFTRNDTAAGISAMLGLTALGSGANGDGGSILLNGKSSTTAAQAMGLLSWSWVNATHASRTAKMSFSAYDTAARLGLEILATGSASNVNLNGDTTMVGSARLMMLMLDDNVVGLNNDPVFL
jgi:hypothetical protein